MGRVLLVDDDAAIRTVVSEALRRVGHRVSAAATLAEADQLLVRDAPELVVTDVVLPDGDGLEHWREVAGRLPVIVLSAQNTLSTAVRANEAGATGPSDASSRTVPLSATSARASRRVCASPACKARSAVPVNPPPGGRRS